MCGIAGVYQFRAAKPVEPKHIGLMCDTLIHRGPDDGGMYVQGPVGLGHRRLSIIDLSGGHQPIQNEDGSVWIVFNGEIYNHHELRQLLADKDHVFKTQTDTEVIVHLYEEYGQECVSYLRGMFAFAIWDSRLQSLLLARDRVGKKPLFYTLTPDGALVFGSEIKALLAYPGVTRRIELHALDQYLHLLYVPSPLTMYEGVFKLPAGHVLVCNSSGHRLHQYWDLIYPVDSKPLRAAEYQEQFLEIFKEAVGIRLESEVPLGAFLSGGLDSSSVVALMAELSDAPVVCASVGFEDEYFNELPYAKEVAEYLRADYHAYCISPKIRELLPKLVWHFDEPFADASAIPTYYVSEVARRHVTVALSGDGGDEVFAGYSRHVQEVIAQWIRSCQTVVGESFFKFAERAWPDGLKGKRSLTNALRNPQDAAIARHYDYILSATLRSQLFSKDLLSLLKEDEGRAGFHTHYGTCTAWTALDKALYLDIKTYLTDDILVKVDRMSMAHGLEVRAPLLDHKLLEFMASVPASQKIHGRTTKYLLRKTMRSRLPPQVTRREKHGFGLPLSDWLRRDLREMVEDLLFDGTARTRGYFDQAALRSVWESHVRGDHVFVHLIWAVLVFELWHRQFLDTIPASGALVSSKPALLLSK